MTQPARPMKPGAVREACDSIRSAVDAFDRGDGLGALLRAYRTLEQLRESYQVAPGAFGPHVEELRELGGLVRARLDGAAQDLVDRLHAVRDAIGSLQAEEKVLRGAIVELCKARGVGTVDIRSNEVLVQAKRFTTLRVPKKGSREHERLVEILNHAGCLDQVSMISAAKLAAAVRRGRLQDEAAEEVRGLCPGVTSYRLQVLPLAGRGMAGDATGEDAAGSRSADDEHASEAQPESEHSDLDEEEGLVD